MRLIILAVIIFYFFLIAEVIRWNS